MKGVFKAKGLLAVLVALGIIATQTSIINADTQKGTDAATASSNAVNSVNDANSDLTGFEKITENENLILYANGATGEIATKVKQTGYVWRSNPADREKDQIAKGEKKKNLDSQLMLSYTQGYTETTVNSLLGCVNKKGLKLEKKSNGVKFMYNFVDVGFTIPVQYTLEKDYLKAEILVQEITPPKITKKEKVAGRDTNVDYNITKIELLPFFGAGGLDEDGYMFIPDGSGAIVNFNNGKTNYDSYYAPVYGKYTDIPGLSKYGNDNVKMPVFGIKKNNNAFLAVINQNESTGFISAVVSGKTCSYNTVDSTFQYRVVETNVGDTASQPMSPVIAPKGNYEVRYYFINGNEANYSGMAKRYQQYLVDEKGLKKTKNVDKSPVYLDLYAGVEKEKSFLGIPRTIFEPLTTYNQLKEISEKMKANGVNDIVIRYMDWMDDSNRGKVPNDVSFEGKLGGKKAFKDFVEYAKANNIGFYPNVDFVNFSKNGNGYYGILNASKAPNQSPAFQTPLTNPSINLGKRWYMLKPDNVVKAETKFYNSYKSYGNEGISLDTLGDSVYSDNAKNGIKRGEVASIWTGIMDNIKNNSGSIMVNNANAYTFTKADHITGAPVPNVSAEISDEAVPFYEMVLHGYVSYSFSPINLTSEPNKNFLKAVESGSNIDYALVKNEASVLKDTYLNYLYSCDFDTWSGTVAEQYKKLDSINKKIAGKKIIGHTKVQDGVYETTYEGNVKVLVNYNKQNVNVAGKTIDAEGFLVQ